MSLNLSVSGASSPPFGFPTYSNWNNIHSVPRLSGLPISHKDFLMNIYMIIQLVTLLATITRGHSCFVVSWTLVIFLLPTPHTLPFQLRPAFRLSIFGLQAPKLRSRLCFVNCRKTHAQHLQSDVSPQKPFSHVNGCYCAVVMVPLVHICPYSSMGDVGCEPIERFLGVWLRRTSEVGKLGGIDASEADMDLCIVSESTLEHNWVKRTVLSFSPSLLLGTLRHGSQPQPASLPPGV